jgi:amino acid transporter
VRRVLGFGDLLLIAAAAIGPAFSLATTFGPMVAAGSSATPMTLLAITAVMACVAAGYRRLGARDPNAGSSYTWVADAFGPVAGAYAAWILIVANIFAIVATSAPAGAYTLALLAPDYQPTPLINAGVGSLWVLAAGVLLWRGLAPTSRVTNVLAVVELCVLGACALAGFAHTPLAGAVAHAAPPGLAGIAGALVVGIWMIDGWEVSASTAEEAENGREAPGAGGFFGLLLTAAVLWICMTSFVRVGTLEGFSQHEADALAYVGGNLGGGVWRLALTATVLVSLAAALQATLIYLSRSLYAMGRNGVLPAAFGALDRRGQPTFAVALLTALGIAGTLAGGASASIGAAFTFILSGTSFFLGVLFLLTAIAAVRLFAGDPSERWSGAVWPGIGAIALLAILAASFGQSDGPTRAFIAGAALAGLPLAVWRARGWGRVRV